MNGISKPKNKYGAGLSCSDDRRSKKKARRALSSLWMARHEMLKFLNASLLSPFATVVDVESEAFESTHAVSLGVCSPLAGILVDKYLNSAVFDILQDQGCNNGSNGSSGSRSCVTSRSIEGVLSLINLLLDKGCLASYKKKDGLIEIMLPKLLEMASCSQVPDSFSNKCRFRNAVMTLRALAATCLVDVERERGETLEESSKRQCKQRSNWGGNSANDFGWIMKVLCDRENLCR